MASEINQLHVHSNGGTLKFTNVAASGYDIVSVGVQEEESP